MQKKITAILILFILMAGLPGFSKCGGPSLSESKRISDSLEYERSLETEYAKEFTVDYYKDGYVLLTTVADEKRFLVIPEGKEVPSDLAEDIVLIHRPVCNVYLVASAVMDMFRGLDAMDTIRFSGQKQDSWYIKEAVELMESGDIVYAGKYSKPDYEMLVSEGCTLAIENTMIFHTPEVTEQLEKFGISVLVDYSSYETHPLARVEWVKFYGALLGCEEQAEVLFTEETEIVKKVVADEKTDLTVCYFYITSNNLVQVKKSSDYIPKMIEIAGGKYIFENLGDEDDTKKTTVNMQVEEFYSRAKDADFLIYNSSIDGGVQTKEELLDKCGLLADFKAVKEGRIWCTTNDFYQQSLSAGYLIEDMHKVLTGNDDELHYLFLLK